MQLLTDNENPFSQAIVKQWNRIFDKMTVFFFLLHTKNDFG